MLEVDRGRLLLSFSPFSDEVGENLRLDSLSRHVRDIVAHELYCPCGDLADRIFVGDDLPKWKACDHLDGMAVELVMQLALGDEDAVD